MDFKTLTQIAFMFVFSKLLGCMASVNSESQALAADFAFSLLEGKYQFLRLQHFPVQALSSITVCSMLSVSILPQVHCVLFCFNYYLKNFMCMDGFFFLCFVFLPACLSVYHLHAWCSRRLEEGIGSP